MPTVTSINYWQNVTTDCRKSDLNTNDVTTFMMMVTMVRVMTDDGDDDEGDDGEWSILHDGLAEDHQVGAVFANLRMRLKERKVQLE